MNIPLGTVVEVKPGLLARLLMLAGRPAAIRQGEIAYREVGERSRLPLYTLSFADGGTGCYFERQLKIPKDCACGTPMEEVSFIPGTGNCFACHELQVMAMTGTGVVRHFPGRRSVH